jgi:hypothetical protein
MGSSNFVIMIEQRPPWLPDPQKEARINRKYDHLFCTAQCCCLALDRLGIKFELSQLEPELKGIRGYTGFAKDVNDLMRPLLAENGYDLLVLDHSDSSALPARERLQRLEILKQYREQNDLPIIISLNYEEPRSLYGAAAKVRRTSALLEEIQPGHRPDVQYYKVYYPYWKPSR